MLLIDLTKQLDLSIHDPNMLKQAQPVAYRLHQPLSIVLFPQMGIFKISNALDPDSFLHYH